MKKNNIIPINILSYYPKWMKEYYKRDFKHLFVNENGVVLGSEYVLFHPNYVMEKNINRKRYFNNYCEAYAKGLRNYDFNKMLNNLKNDIWYEAEQENHFKGEPTYIFLCNKKDIDKGEGRCLIDWFKENGIN